MEVYKETSKGDANYKVFTKKGKKDKDFRNSKLNIIKGLTGH